jgi:hypothetical protein
MNHHSSDIEEVMENLDDAVEIAKAFSETHGVEFDGSLQTAIKIAHLIGMASLNTRQQYQNIDMQEEMQQINKTLEEGLHRIYLEI